MILPHRRSALCFLPVWGVARGAMLLCLLMATAVPAQVEAPGKLPVAQYRSGVVVPPAHRDVEAPGLAFWALSPFDARRQVIIVAQLLAPLQGTSLRAIAVRRNGGDQDPYSGGTIDLEIWMSDRARNPWVMSSNFAANRGANHQKVFDGRIAIPDTPPAPARPAPWASPYSLTIPFDRPFAYTSNALCIETVTRSTGDDPWWPIDTAVERMINGQYQAYGFSCIRQAPAFPAAADIGSLTIGASASFYLRTSTPTMPAPPIALFGTSRTQYGSASLPLLLTAFGAPGCSLFTDVLFAIPAAVTPLPGNNRGIARVSIGIPGSQGLRGAKLFNQWMVFEPIANPLGITLSNGVDATIGSSRRRNVGWLESTDLTAPSGVLMPGRAPVLFLLN